jgi:hypothetical protein
MSQKKFTAAFLSRLALVMLAIEREQSNADDPEPLQPEDYEAIYAAYRESGGDPSVVKKRMAAAREQCSQALGRILQYIADRYDAGPVERLDDRALEAIARDAFEASENWCNEVAMADRVIASQSPLQALLESHYRLNEALLDLHDHILWPIAKQISPGE